MKVHYYLFLGWAFVISLVACKHDQDTISPIDGGKDNPNDSGVVTEVGQPQGAATRQTIGPAGGTIRTPDGTAQLVIPAGSVSQATEITIQPITNYAPNGLGLAYRFSPDGLQFTKPATLTFRYKAAAVAANDPDMLAVAFQSSDKRWQGVADVSVDTASHQISVPMPHFSDWTAFELAKIDVLNVDGKSQLDFGASTELTVGNLVLEPLKNPGKESFEVDVNHIKWSVAGGDVNGQIKGNGEKATYTAPGSYPPQNPIAVVAEISFKSSTKKVFLIKRILIGRDYFTCTIGGIQYDWTHISCSQLSSLNTHLSGYNLGPDQSLNINIYTALKVGHFAYTNPTEKAGVWAEFSEDYNTGTGYISSIIPCPVPPKWLTSKGGVTITQIDEVNGQTYVRGRISGTYFNPPDNCPDNYKEKIIQGEFRIRATISK